jgi:hypothetical protein
MSDQAISSRTQWNRRELGKLALGGALGATLLSSAQPGSAVVRSQPPGDQAGFRGSCGPNRERFAVFQTVGCGLRFLRRNA